MWLEHQQNVEEIRFCKSSALLPPGVHPVVLHLLVISFDGIFYLFIFTFLSEHDVSPVWLQEVRRVWMTPVSHRRPPLHPRVHLCWRPPAAGPMGSKCLTWTVQTCPCLTGRVSRTLTPEGTLSAKRSWSRSRWSRRPGRFWCPTTWRWEALQEMNRA